MLRPSFCAAGAVLLFAAGAAAQPYPPPPPPGYSPAYQTQQPPPAPPANSPAGEAQIQTPGAYGHSSVEHAAEAPLHDLNIVRQKIPPVLLAAMADPYARVPRANCRALDVRIADLTAALGPDYDQPGMPRDPTLRGKAGTTALSLAHGAAESLLPFNSYVSTLSGAQRHDALVIQAINAGTARRSYLKGLGESHGCRPPDAPSHLAYPAPPVQEERTKPLYPIR